MKRLTASAGIVFSFAFLVSLIACGGGGGGGGTPPPITTPTPPAYITVSAQPFPLSDAVVGDSLSVTFSATGGYAPYTWTAPYELPTGLTLNSSTGVVSGTLAAPGGWYIQVLATDARGNQASGTVYVAVNSRLDIDTQIATAHTHVPYQQNIVVPGNYYSGYVTLSLVSGQLPPGFTFQHDYLPASLSGTPASTGTYNFRLRADLNSNPPQSVERDLILTVDDALWITSTSIADAIQNSPYTSAPLEVVNGQAPYHFTSTDLPSGLTIDSATGVVSGTPTIYATAGTTFHASVTDSSNPQKSATGEIRIYIGTPLAVEVSTVSGRVSEPLYGYLNISGGRPPYTGRVVSGTLPNGVTFNPGDQYNLPQFQGVPTAYGNSTVTIEITDGETPAVSVSKEIQISILPPYLGIDYPQPPMARQGVPYSYEFVAHGGVPPYTWSVQRGPLPLGLTLDPSSGVLSGTPVVTEPTRSIQIQVMDSYTTPQTNWTSFQMRVAPHDPHARNDTVATATPLNGVMHPNLSLSPYHDDYNPQILSDNDYFQVSAKAGNTVTVEVDARNILLDPVVEIVNASGQRYVSGCSTLSGNLPNCLDDDMSPGNRNAYIQFLVPGTTGADVVFYVHVFDWRGDARPEMRYDLTINGAN